LGEGYGKKEKGREGRLTNCGKFIANEFLPIKEKRGWKCQQKTREPAEGAAQQQGGRKGNRKILLFPMPQIKKPPAKYRELLKSRIMGEK